VGGEDCPRRKEAPKEGTKKINRARQARKERKKKHGTETRAGRPHAESQQRPETNPAQSERNRRNPRALSRPPPRGVGREIGCAVEKPKRWYKQPGG